MGFLRKEWDFENPAEHSMDAHDAYRDEGWKDSKPWLWALGLLCGGVSVYTLYYVERYLYRGAVDTNWAGWLGTMIGTCIAAGLHLFKEPKPITDKWGKRKKIAGSCVLAVFCVVIAIYIWKHQRLWILGMQFLSLLPVVFVLDRAQKAGADKSTVKGWDLLLTFALLAIVTLFGPKLLGMTSVADGEKLLRVEGYEGIYFDDITMPRWLDEEMAEQAQEKQSADLEDAFVYLYGGVKDGKSYGILVDPYGSGILATGENLPGTKVYDWLEN